MTVTCQGKICDPNICSVDEKSKFKDKSDKKSGQKKTKAKTKTRTNGMNDTKGSGKKK